MLIRIKLSPLRERLVILSVTQPSEGGFASLNLYDKIKRRLMQTGHDAATVEVLTGGGPYAQALVIGLWTNNPVGWGAGMICRALFQRR